MENIEVLYHTRKPVDTSEFGTAIQCHLQNYMACYITDKQYIIIVNLDSSKIEATKLHSTAENTKYIQYIILNDVLVLGNDNNLLLFHPKTKEFDVLYTSDDSRIVAFSFNPAQNFLVIIKENDEILGFACDGDLEMFDLIHQSSLDAAVPSTAYVGWGSHNTQFKGPKNKKTENIEILDISVEYQEPNISWRGNGEQFVINYWDNGKRFLKVYNSTLHALYKSEEYPNLEKVASFKGQGNCIACPAVRNSENKIVIFEKNCLVKSEFFIPENKGEVLAVLFHPYKNLLAIHSHESRRDLINIYVVSNAKWYMKQQIHIPEDKTFVGFSWINDDLQPTISKLSIATCDGLEIFTFRFVINRAPTSGIVTLVDGKTAHFTFFEREIVPPPLSSFQFESRNAINKIYFHPKEPYCLIFDATNNMTIVQYNETELTAREVYYGSISGNDQGDGESPIEYFKNIPNFLNDINKNVLTFNDTIEEIAGLDLDIDENKEIMYCTGKTINNTFYEFALTYSQKLLVNKVQVASDISSILIYKDYVLLTYRSQLYTIRINKHLLGSSNWDIPSELPKYYYQEIEQGIKLYTVVRNSSTIIVSVPRGNIECVSSRVITIDVIEEFLKNSMWTEAIDLIRKEKLNWNLLVDLNPTRFEENLIDFVDSAEPMGMLTSIVSEITTENCLTTMYSQCLFGSKYEIQNKAKIFMTMLDFLNKDDGVDHFGTIVIILSKYFSLLSAIKGIHSVFVQDEDCRELCEDAVNQLLLYFDRKDIIVNSYMVFDTRFVGLVHLWCCQDPCVFEPELKKLEELPEVQRRFEMCILAREFGVAVKYLLKFEDVESSFITNFISKHKVYKEAYTGLEEGNKYFKTVSKMYGDHLFSWKKYDQSAFVFLRANLLEDALIAYKKALNWNQALTLIEGFDDEDFKNVFLNDLAKELVDAKKLDVAVMIYTNYLNDYPSAIRAYMDNHQFQNALSIAARQTTEQLLNLSDYTNAMNEKIVDLDKNFDKYLTRLEVLRKEKTSKHLESQELGGDYNVFEGDDLYSEYGSTIVSTRSTTMSRSSTATAKNRRKEARKKIDLREGGFYEDIAIIRHLYLLITEAFELGKEVREVSLTPIKDKGHLSECKRLQDKLVSLQTTMKNSFSIIWSKEFLSEPVAANIAISHNKEHLEEKYRNPPVLEELDEAWMCDIF